MPDKDLLLEKAQQKLETLGKSEFKKHIFLCSDPTRAKCCRQEEGLAAWDYLKKRVKELNQEGHVGIFRTKS